MLRIILPILALVVAALVYLAIAEPPHAPRLIETPVDAPPR